MISTILRWKTRFQQSNRNRTMMLSSKPQNKIPQRFSKRVVLMVSSPRKGHPFPVFQSAPKTLTENSTIVGNPYQIEWKTKIKLKTTEMTESVSQLLAMNTRTTPSPSKAPKEPKETRFKHRKKQLIWTRSWPLASSKMSAVNSPSLKRTVMLVNETQN